MIPLSGFLWDSAIEVVFLFIPTKLSEPEFPSIDPYKSLEFVLISDYFGTEFLDDLGKFDISLIDYDLMLFNYPDSVLSSFFIDFFG